VCGFVGIEFSRNHASDVSMRITTALFVYIPGSIFAMTKAQQSMAESNAPKPHTHNAA
jgi:hypothetical protein